MVAGRVPQEACSRLYLGALLQARPAAAHGVVTSANGAQWIDVYVPVFGHQGRILVADLPCSARWNPHSRSAPCAHPGALRALLQLAIRSTAPADARSLGTFGISCRRTSDPLERGNLVCGLGAGASCSRKAVLPGGQDRMARLTEAPSCHQSTETRRAWRRWRCRHSCARWTACPWCCATPPIMRPGLQMSHCTCCSSHPPAAARAPSSSRLPFPACS